MNALYFGPKLKQILIESVLKVSAFTSGHKGVATFSQDLHEVVSKITAGQVQTHDGMRKSIALVNRHVVGDTITRIKNNTCMKQMYDQTNILPL